MTIEHEVAVPPAGSPERYAWPPLFALLELQFGAAVGFLQTAVPLWLARDGIPLDQIAAVSTSANSAHFWKLFWTPIVDVLPHRRAWYGACMVATAGFAIACATIADPSHHLVAYGALLFGLQATAATAHGALNGLMATTTRLEDKGRTGGWQMAGNVGSTSLLGAVPIWIAGLWSREAAGAVMAAIVVGSGSAIFLVPRRPLEAAGGRSAAALLRRLGDIFRDLFKTAFSRNGIVMVILCLLPVSCGALTNLFSAMADAYHVGSANLVGIINGPAMGISGAVGSLVGGFTSDRLNRKINYALWGGVTGLCAFGMALAPMTRDTYVVGTVLYSLANGAAFAAFAGMVLETVTEGAAVTTKYTLFVASSNLAINYTEALDGLASRFHGIGARASIVFDGLITFAGIAALLAIFFLFLRKKPQAQPQVA